MRPPVSIHDKYVRSLLPITQKLIRRRHHNYLWKWAERLQLNDEKIVLLAFPFSHRHHIAARLWFRYNKGYSFVLLSDRALSQPRGRNGWKACIVHELAHLLFWRHLRGRRLSTDREESMVKIIEAALLP
jgi:hypothetical protein